MINVTKNNDIINVDIAGLINEDLRVPKLDLKGVKGINFNFDQVDAINSIGVKIWMSFLLDIPRGMPIKYIKCRRVVVDQMNMVMGFKPAQVVVESFYVPYMCTDACASLTQVLYSRGKEVGENNKVAHPAEALCPKCKVPMQMDVMEAKYFRFLTRK